MDTVSDILDQRSTPIGTPRAISSDNFFSPTDDSLDFEARSRLTLALSADQKLLYF
jgi:hypothetical protein